MKNDRVKEYKNKQNNRALENGEREPILINKNKLDKMNKEENSE